MPKVTIKYEGEQHDLLINPKSAGKKEIEQALQENWSLSPKEYNLTYIDMDNDEITAEVEEDFEVANVTMIDENRDALEYTLNLRGNAQPKFQKHKEQEAT